MGLKVAFTARAETDLAGIVDYISDDNPRAADRVYAELRDRCQLLAETPEIGIEAYPGVRRIVVGSYLIFYRLGLSGATNGIEILRIIHGARQIPSNLGG